MSAFLFALVLMVPFAVFTVILARRQRKASREVAELSHLLTVDEAMYGVVRAEMIEENIEDILRRGLVEVSPLANCAPGTWVGTLQELVRGGYMEVVGIGETRGYWAYGITARGRERLAGFQTVRPTSAT